jgi:hypothetical protein
VHTCGTVVYDSLQFIVWTSICQVSGRGRYRRFRRIFGVENCQLSQWNSIRIVLQRLCRNGARARRRARERASVRACVRACARACVRACVRARICVL